MINDLEQLKIYIQNNKEIFLTDDLTMYEILSKMVDYINELITRMTQLNTMLTNYETATDSKLADMQKEITAKFTEIDTLYNAFTKDITAQIARLNQTTSKNYTDVVNQLESSLKVFIVKSENDFNTYKTTIQGIVDTKTSEVDTALAGLNVDSSVQTYMNTLVTNGTFDSLISALYGNYFYLSYVGTKASFPTTYSYMNNYFYATDEDKLYFGSSTKYNLIDIKNYTIYFYNNKIYLPKLVNSVLVLRENGVV